MAGMDVQTIDRTGKSYIILALGNAEVRSHVASALKLFYQFGNFSDIPRASAACRMRMPLVAVIGEELAPSNGYDLVHMLRLDPALASIPVVIMVARDDGRTRAAVAKSGAQCHLVNACSSSVLLATVSSLINRGVERRWQDLPPLQSQALASTLKLFNGLSAAIGTGNPVLYGDVSEACKPLVDAVACDDYKGILSGVRNHDNYTYAHSLQVATLLALFGSNLGLSKDEQAVLASGGLLHDVGKMSIPTEVLNKPGRLSPKEFIVMKGHVEASIAHLERCPDLPKGILTIAAQHHEKLNGTGYPYGLTAKRLDELARMASIIDVFSALTDRRVYKPSMSPEAALKVMTEEMTSHLDMKLLGLFRQMLLDTAQ
jgi:putative nucleotidyltransferase with HDIG domain